MATALADALRGQLKLGPLDIARLAVAAKQVPADRVARLALRHWVAVDPRARDRLRMTLLFAMKPRNAAQAADKTGSALFCVGHPSPIDVKGSRLPAPAVTG